MRRVYSATSMTEESLLVGSNHSAGTLRLRAFLAQNACVYTYLDLDRDPAVQWLLDQFAVRPEEVPILICRGRTGAAKSKQRQGRGCSGCEIESRKTRHVGH